jgi:hypothetical protein
MTIETFALRNASKIFPAKLTRVVWNDLIGIANKNKKFLTKEEYEYFMSARWSDIFEVLIERENGKIKVFPID